MFKGQVVVNMRLLWSLSKLTVWAILACAYGVKLLAPFSPNLWPRMMEFLPFTTDNVTSIPVLNILPAS